jgi:hypothetical protein
VERPDKKAPQPSPTWQRKQICGGRPTHYGPYVGKKWSSATAEILCITRRAWKCIPHAGLLLWADPFNGRFFVIFGSFAIFHGFLDLLGFSVFFWVEFFNLDLNFILIQNLLKFEKKFKYIFCSHTTYVEICPNLKYVQIRKLLKYQKYSKFEFCSYTKIVQIRILFIYENCSNLISIHI